jgi:hypothetical protein
MGAKLDVSAPNGINGLAASCKTLASWPCSTPPLRHQPAALIGRHFVLPDRLFDRRRLVGLIVDNPHQLGRRPSDLEEDVIANVEGTFDYLERTSLGDLGAPTEVFFILNVNSVVFRECSLSGVPHSDRPFANRLQNCSARVLIW